MFVDVMEHYGLKRSLREAGYFETAHHRRISRELDAAIRQGGLIALCGIVGCGKTVLLNRTKDALQEEGEILVARSLAVDTSEVSLETLIMTMLYDISVEKDVKLPAQAKRRERLLLSLIEQRGRPVALFADDAHGIGGDTLRELKRFIERVNLQHGRLSVVLAGQPTLGDDLRHPALDEIGTRTTLLELDDLRGQGPKPTFVSPGATSARDLLDAQTRAHVQGKAPRTSSVNPSPTSVAGRHRVVAANQGLQSDVTDLGQELLAVSWSASTPVALVHMNNQELRGRHHDGGYCRCTHMAAVLDQHRGERHRIHGHYQCHGLQGQEGLEERHDLVSGMGRLLIDRS